MADGRRVYMSVGRVCIQTLTVHPIKLLELPAKRVSKQNNSVYTVIAAGICSMANFVCLSIIFN